MPPGQQDFVERAMEEVSSPPLPGQIALEREIRRRAWGYPPDPRIYGIIRQRFLPSAETPERRRLAIGLLTELVAASTQGSIGENLDLVSDSLEGKTEAQQIRTMRRLLRTAERRGRRLTRRDLERTI
jgi:hypothetical protein